MYDVTALMCNVTYVCRFEINDHTGEPLTDDEVTASHYEKVGMARWGEGGLPVKGNRLCAVMGTEGYWNVHPHRSRRSRIISATLVTLLPELSC